MADGNTKTHRGEKESNDFLLRIPFSHRAIAFALGNIYRTVRRKIISGYVGFDQTSRGSRVGVCRGFNWFSLPFYLRNALTHICENMLDVVAGFLAVVSTFDRFRNDPISPSRTKNTDTLNNENLWKLKTRKMFERTRPIEHCSQREFSVLLTGGKKNSLRSTDNLDDIRKLTAIGARLEDKNE